jgi:hypothetical protein
MELFDEVITTLNVSILNQRKYNAQILKQNQILLNHILVCVYSLYGTLVQIIYMKLVKIGMIIFVIKVLNLNGNTKVTAIDFLKTK